MAAQHDYTFEDQTGPQIRSDLNNAMLAIVGKNWGPGEPTTTFKYMWWLDTTANLLKIRNAANNAWIEVGDPALANLGLAKLIDGKLPISKGGTGKNTASLAWDALKQLATDTVPGAVLNLRGHIDGFKFLAAGASANMSISAGQCVDLTNAVMFNVAALTKTTATWASGDATGGLDNGTIAANTTYHWFAIRRSDTGVTDIIYSTSPTTPVLPTNYDEKRRIGSWRTDGSSQWYQGHSTGDKFRLFTKVRDVNESPSSADTRITKTLTSCPTGIVIDALLGVNIKSIGTTTNLNVVALNEADLSAANFQDVTITALFTSAGAFVSQAIEMICELNTSAQLAYRCSNSSGNTIVTIWTLGWIDRRGKDD